MVPASVTFLEALPYINGKLERRALPQPRRDRPALESPYIAPTNDVETEVERIWEEILSVSPIGIHDAFLDLGGHSLAAMQVLSRIVQDFAVDIPLRRLFDAPTIATFAQIVAASRAANTEVHRYDGELAKIESLSEDGAAALLARISPRNTRG